MWHPLKPELRTKFDSKKAWDWFGKTQGLPYGYHNFIFGWIDTAEDNWPPLLAREIMPVVGNVMEHVIPKKARILFTEALNKRLGV